VVQVTDNGPGIPEEIRKRVFDPFFTTKQTGKGTGLGLWISYSIIEKMGGSISLSSRVGEGTSFTVRIPIVVPEKK
jgi:two-component system, NtrC family, sensor kinase